MDEMRRYLERVVPWGNPDAWVNLHFFFVLPAGQKSHNTGKDPVIGRAYKSLDELANFAKFNLRNNKAHDHYICMSTQALAEPLIDKRGVPYQKAIRSRHNAVQIKSFFIDVDVKDGAYPDQQTALKAMAEFLKATGMPRPTVLVSSGTGGLHIYWTLDQPITLDEWQPYATALAKACMMQGFITKSEDLAIIVDGARILRLPGTFNHKGGGRLPVKLLGTSAQDLSFEAIKTALEPFREQGVAQALPPRQLDPLASGGDLAAGIERSAPPVNLDNVALECAFIAEALATGGKSFGGDLWRSSLLCASFSVGERADAHRVSHGYPHYDPAETDKVYDDRVRYRLEKNLGWPRCDTIARGFAGCAACPHRTKGKSPLNFQAYVAPPAPVVTAPGNPPAPITPPQHQLNGHAVAIPNSDMPPGYVRGTTGIIFKLTPQPDNTTQHVPVCSYPILKGWVQDNPWTLMFSTRISPTRAIQVMLPYEDLGTKNTLVKRLGGQGIAVNDRQTKLLGEFFVAWIDKLREVKASVVSAIPMGWHMADNGDIAGFAYGGDIYTPTGKTHASLPDREIGKQYTPRGVIDPWRVAVKMITDQNQPQLNAIIATSFAAPLVKLTGYKGFLLSIYSADSGIGKTTAIEIAQAVWGVPRAVQGLTDTHASFGKRIGQLQSLPVYWDEIKTDKDADEFVNTIFQITRGREKNRMKSDTSLQAGGEWDTLIIVASNNSMIDHVARGTRATTAGIHRVLEYTAHKSTQFKLDFGTVTRLVSQCNDNFGRAGQIYAEFLGNNVDRIRKDIEALSTVLHQKYNARPEERNWFGTIVCLLLGWKYAKECGLVDGSTQELQAFLLDYALANIRKTNVAQGADLSKEINIAEILSQFLRHVKTRHALLTDEMQLVAGRPPLNGYKVLSDTSKLEALWVHSSLKQGVVRFACTEFNTWLRNNKLPIQVVIDALTQTYGMTRSNGRLGAGTPYAWDVKAHYYEIQNRKLILEDEDDGDKHVGPGGNSEAPKTVGNPA
jgi:hypothetical protein